MKRAKFDTRAFEDTPVITDTVLSVNLEIFIHRLDARRKISLFNEIVQSFDDFDRTHSNLLFSRINALRFLFPEQLNDHNLMQQFISKSMILLAGYLRINSEMMCKILILIHMSITAAISSLIKSRSSVLLLSQVFQLTNDILLSQSSDNLNVVCNSLKIFNVIISNSSKKTRLTLLSGLSFAHVSKFSSIEFESFSSLDFKTACESIMLIEKSETSHESTIQTQFIRVNRLLAAINIFRIQTEDAIYILSYLKSSLSIQFSFLEQRNTDVKLSTILQLNSILISAINFHCGTSVSLTTDIFSNLEISKLILSIIQRVIQIFLCFSFKKLITDLQKENIIFDFCLIINTISPYLSALMQHRLHSDANAQSTLVIYESLIQNINSLLIVSIKSNPESISLFIASNFTEFIQNIVMYLDLNVYDETPFKLLILLSKDDSKGSFEFMNHLHQVCSRHQQVSPWKLLHNYIIDPNIRIELSASTFLSALKPNFSGDCMIWFKIYAQVIRIFLKINTLSREIFLDRIKGVTLIVQYKNESEYNCWLGVLECYQLESEFWRDTLGDSLFKWLIRTENGRDIFLHFFHDNIISQRIIENGWCTFIVCLFKERDYRRIINFLLECEKCWYTLIEHGMLALLFDTLYNDFDKYNASIDVFRKGLIVNYGLRKVYLNQEFVFN